MVKEWEIYCCRRGKKSQHQEYLKNLQVVGEFNIIADFLGYYHSMKAPSELEVDTKLQFFLKGCSPLWEQWLDSGEFYISIHNYKDKEKLRIGNSIMDHLWEYLLFSMVGNTLPSTKTTLEPKGHEDIIGMQLNKRENMTLIEIWFRTDKHALQLSRKIEAEILQELALILKKDQPYNITFKYKQHKESAKMNSTMKGSHNFKHAMHSLNDSF